MEEQVTRENNFTLMPNPNNGTFIIRGSIGSATGDVFIRITDMLGQEVYTSVAQSQNGNLNATVTLGRPVAAGMYLVNIATAGGNAVFHVLISQ